MRKTILAIAATMGVLMSANVSAIAATIKAHIDISSQTMTVYKGGKVMYRWKVSTARNGYITPTGTYRPTRMHKMWYSRKYDMSPMPYSIFFRGGYAIHGTNAVKRLGSPASHGCVRLHPSNAATLYSLVKQHGAKNTRITITR